MGNVVTFSAGVVTVRVSVTIIDDREIEEDETFSAVLSTSQPNVVINNTTATVNIVDFDSELSFTVFWTYIIMCTSIIIA